ncbi:MAG: hypothetical protein JXD22_01700 [Sedimentisphaerales bacterium]|nr:hypothetical protein [Sedimentisphaerales bacterium]
MNKIWILILSVLLLSMTGTGLADPEDSIRVNTIYVGVDKQLFIDDLFFEEVDGVKLKLNPAQKTGEKNLQRDKPWECYTPNWFSIMDDNGKYRMWYEAYDGEDEITKPTTSFCYAESKDGIKWTKPSLGLFEYNGNKQNNILFKLIGPPNCHSRVHGTGVFKDPSAPPEQRYKGVGQGLWADKKPAYRIAGMYSADGLHWTRYPQPIIDEPADSQYSGFWDSSIRKYVVYGRANQWSYGRSVGRSESKDFTRLAPLNQVLHSDENDPPNSDLYNPAAVKYPYAANAYFMFTSLFQKDPQTLDIRLAVSRDGLNWTWPEQEKPFIPLGKPGEFDCGSLYMGQGIIRIGDELWQYYGGSPQTHNGTYKELILPGYGRSYSRVISRLDGYVSVDAGPEGGYFITPLLTFWGNKLKLNVKVRPGGMVRVGLLDEVEKDIPDYSTDSCLPITGDYIEKTVEWQMGANVSARAGTPTRLQIEMKDSSLYAFQFMVDYSN